MADILSAIQRYCQYQERCHMEVRGKLYELGCDKSEVEQYLTELIEMDLLNEERYARAIARGKFRQKQWGKQKVLHHLRQHKISEYCIKKAMQEIDEDEYQSTIDNLSAKKWHEFRTERSVVKRKGKLYRYLTQKGYSSQEINDAIKNLIDS